MGFNKEVFAANLRAARAALDMSQEELAKAVGVSNDVIVKRRGIHAGCGQDHCDLSRRAQKPQRAYGMEGDGVNEPVRKSSVLQIGNRH